MTIQEFYAAVGGDYDAVIGRLKKEERVKKFARLFLEDPSYGQLVDNIREQNTDEAFRAAHTLKGVCQNLSFTRLYEAAYEITESLRCGDLAKAKEQMTPVQDAYQVIIEALDKIEA